MVPTLIGITLVTFLIIQLAPGSPAEMKIRRDQSGALGEQYTREVIEQTKKLYGLDKPIHIRYLIWLRQVATLNFGDSYKDHRPVIKIILERIPVTRFRDQLLSGSFGLLTLPKDYRKMLSDGESLEPWIADPTKELP